MAIKHIVCNKIRTPDGTVLQSFYGHDFKTYRDGVSGEVYMVDGGCNYLRRNVNKVEYEELSVYDDQPHEIIRENMCWGTYGKDGNEKLKYVVICDMADEHIKNVIKTKSASQHIEKIFMDELLYREKHDMHIEQ